MKEHTFKEKLSQYITMSAAFLVAHSEKADAQIMYTDVNPDLVIQNSYFNLDLNNDGVVDFVLNHDENGTGTYTSGGNSSWWAQDNDFIQCLGQNELVKMNPLSSSNNYPIPIPECQSIGVNNAFTQNGLLHTFFQSATNSNWNTFFNGNFWGTDKIVGVKIVTGVIVNYGWIRLDVENTFIRLKDYAFELTPDSSISDSINLSAVADSICVYKTGAIDLTVVNNAGGYTYNWNTADSIEDLTGLNGGIYSVTVTSSMGCSASLNIPIFNIVPAPTIIDSNHVIYSSWSGKNQWYVYSPNNPLQGDTLNYFIPTYSAYYLAEAISPDGCSNFSNKIYFTYVVGIENADAPIVSISVNDNKKLLFHLNDNSLLGNQIEIINQLGQLVTTVTVTNQIPEADLSALPAGIYFFHIRTKQKKYSGKFFIE